MNFPRAGLAGAAVALFALAGCASVTDGSVTSPSAAAPTSPSSPASSTPTGFPGSTSTEPSSSAGSTAPTGGFPTDVSSLAAFVRAGTQSIKTAHISLVVGVEGQSVTAEGDEKIENGKATSLALVEKIPSVGTIEIRIVDSTKIYLKGPPSMRTGSKPWTKIDSSTSNPTLRQIYLSLLNSQSFGSLESANAFVSAATDFRFAGTGDLDGTTIGSYEYSVDVSKLPSNFPNKQQLGATGLTTIPVKMAVDEKGRAREFDVTIKVGSVTTTAKSALSDFDQPVTIEAPPASQVSSS